MVTEASTEPFLPAGSRYFDLELEVLNLQREASDVAVAEIMGRDGVPLNFDHFMLATHGYGRSVRGNMRADDIQIREFYDGLDEEFGSKQSSKLIALLSDGEHDGRQRILRIGEIDALPEPGQPPAQASPIVYRLAKSHRSNAIDGCAYVRVRGVEDVSGQDSPTNQTRAGDERLVDAFVRVEDGTATELWELSYASTNVKLPSELPAATRGYYAVGVNAILAARSFEERNWIDRERDQVYLQVVLAAMKRHKLARSALQTA